MTNIHNAAELGEVERVKELLDADPANMNKIKAFGQRWTPLCCAAKWGRTEVVRLLIDRGADVHNKDSGKTALNLARISKDTWGDDFDNTIITLLEEAMRK